MSKIKGDFLIFPVLIGFLTLLSVSACGPPKHVGSTLARVDRDSASLRAENERLLRKVEDLSNTVMVMQDRLETLKLAVDRQSVAVRAESERPSRKLKGQARKAPARKVRAEAPEEEGGEAFLIEPDPRESALPTLQLSNRDLDRANRRGVDPGTKPALKENASAGTNVVESNVGDPIKSPDNPEATRTYNEAFALFETQKYPEAASALESFIKKYPLHTYADDAIYWIGESFFRMGNLDQALAQFQRVTREYPAGAKVPNALLRAGDCFLRLGRGQDAVATFEKVIGSYPKSVAAERAKEWIARNAGTYEKGRM